MKNSTNILLLVVILLLVALFVDKRIENNSLRAYDGAIDHIIFATDPLTKDRFYLVNVEKKNILYYEYDGSSKSILLKAARQFDFDELALSPYTLKNATGDSYAVVKSVVEAGAKPKR